MYSRVLCSYAPTRFTLILCADVLWNTFSHPALIQSLQSLLAPTTSSRVTIISGFHTGREPLARFLRLAAFKGLVPDALGFVEREVGTGQEREWVEKREDGEIKERNRWTLEGNLKWNEDTLNKRQRET